MARLLWAPSRTKGPENIGPPARGKLYLENEAVPGAFSSDQAKEGPRAFIEKR